MIPRDQLLDEVGRALRQRDPLSNPRWSALTAGTLSPEDEDELRASVERGAAPPAAWEALRPLDAAERAAIFDALFAEDLQPGSEVHSESSAAAAQSSTEAARRSAAAVIPIATWRRRARVASTVLGIAAAASISGVMLLQPSQPGLASRIEHQLTVDVDGDTVRGVEAIEGVVSLPPGRSLSARLETAPSATGSVRAATGKPVEVRVFAVEAGAVRPLLTMQAISGRPTVLPPIPRSVLSSSAVADVRVVFAVGPANELADPQALRDQVVAGRGRGNIEVFWRTVRLVPR